MVIIHPRCLNTGDELVICAYLSNKAVDFVYTRTHTYVHTYWHEHMCTHVHTHKGGWGAGLGVISFFVSVRM